MQHFDYDAEYFNPEHTLECGQVFRFTKIDGGYLVFSADKACRVTSDGIKTTVESEDADYFFNYFDLDRNYKEIVDCALSYSIPLLSKSATLCKGLRILNQNKEEMIYSFIISQNNNIPRIKGIIDRICASLGDKREFYNSTYYTFPTSEKLANADVSLFKQVGAGYRDEYLSATSKRICAEGIAHLEGLDSDALKKALLGYKGIGPKVADCISLFAFRKCDSFPVDTWVEKIYREDFGGELTNREKISKFFVEKFGNNSGYIQQYLFYGKRLNL
jgi:N-glycosylase/DNA lyase